jgi:alcohol-forming fatty acyl-CoA reductase
MTVKE